MSIIVWCGELWAECLVQPNLIVHLLTLRKEKIMAKKASLIFLFISLYAVCCLLSTAWGDVNNTIAYGVSNTSSTGLNDLNVLGTKTVAQTIVGYDSNNGLCYGVLVYLDRIGLSSSTDSVRLRFRGNAILNVCTTPDTSKTPKREAYVKVTDIPDGDADGSTMPPDSIGRGYAVWFIFPTPCTLTSDDCYTIFLNAPNTDANNRICWNSGTNGYASDLLLCHYQ